MDFKVMNMMQLDFKDSSIQSILAFYSIIHIPKNEITKVFTEFSRVLKPNGLLILAVHEGTTEQVIDEMLGYKTTLYVDFFTDKELTEKLSQSNYLVQYSHTRKPYEFEHQTNRVYIIAKSMKK